MLVIIIIMLLVSLFLFYAGIAGIIYIAKNKPVWLSDVSTAKYVAGVLIDRTLADYERRRLKKLRKRYRKQVPYTDSEIAILCDYTSNTKKKEPR